MMMESDSLVRSERLMQLIKDAIGRSKQQRISFERFMKMVLFTPSVGYYQATENLLGEKGDFTTAPEISTIFSSCLANYCQPILQSLSTRRTIVELGPGTGRLAAELLLQLEKMTCLPARYVLIEPGEVLRRQQKRNLKLWIPHLMHLLEFRECLGVQSIEGIILANEVMDALPVHRFELTGNALYLHYVSYDGRRFVVERGVPNSALLKGNLQPIQERYLKGVDSYLSEVRPSLKPWFSRLAASLSKGCMILIDYGQSAREYYHPDRTTGTLRCYYRHHCYTDPLMRVGLQDITSDVDFTQLANLALASGLQLIAFVTQSAFLVATGLLSEETLGFGSNRYLNIKGQVHHLIHPLEMGTRCKVMLLARGLCGDLLSLKEYDQRVLL